MQQKYVPFPESLFQGPFELYVHPPQTLIDHKHLYDIFISILDSDLDSNADINGDGMINVLDVVQLVSIILKNAMFILDVSLPKKM